MQDMRKDVHDDDSAYFNDSDGSSVRECAKIRVEDREAQEFVNELSREFDKFTERLALENESFETVLEDDEEHSHISMGTGLPEGARADEYKGFELKLSVLDRLLKFFGEFYERFITERVVDGKNQSFTLRERRKKRFLLEALIMMLRKLFMRGKTLSVAELLDEQIKELREALEKEQDPEIRKLLQSRLEMLLQLRMQLQNSVSFSGMEKLLMMLIGSSLAGATLSSLRYGGLGIMAESAASYAQTMNRVMDADRIAFSESKRDIGSMHDSVNGEVWGYQSSMDRCVADLLSRGIGKTIGISGSSVISSERLYFAEHLLHADRWYGTNYVADRLLSLVNHVVRNIALAVFSVAQEVVSTAFRFVGAEPPKMMARNLAADRSHHSTVRDTARDLLRDHNMREAHNIPGSDFHHQAHVRVEQNRARAERAESSEGHATNIFCRDMGNIGYREASVTFNYRGEHCTQTSYDRQNTPGQILTEVVTVSAHTHTVEASHQITMR